MKTKPSKYLLAAVLAAWLVIATLTSVFGQPVSTVEFFDLNSYGPYVYEDVVEAVVFVRRTGDLSGTVTVNYATADGQARAGEDYTTTRGTLTFGPGETLKPLSVPVLNDGRKETPGNPDSFGIKLSGPSAGVQLGRSELVVHIVDNDVGIGFNNSPYYSVREEAGQAVITVWRGDDGPGTVSVDYATQAGTATPGVDYAEQSGTLTFGPGEVTRTFTIPILNDASTEDGETILLTLQNAISAAGLGYEPKATLTIEDNDGGIRFANEDWYDDSGLYLAVSEGAGEAIITVLNSGDFTNASSVTYSTADDTARAGTDYVATTGTLTFQRGETNKTFAVPIVDNGVTNGPRTLTLSLRDAGGAVGLNQAISTRLIIEDNERPVRIVNGRSVTFEFRQESYVVSEAQIAAKLVVIRRGETSSAGSVEYATAAGTATPNVDYVAVSGRLEFASLETEKTITIPLNDDGRVEGDETIELTLSNPGAGTGLDLQRTTTLRINDNERPGSLDLSFDAGFIGDGSRFWGAWASVMTLALDADGSILIAGHLGAVNGIRRTGIARLLPDGAVDPAFVPGAWIDGHQLAVQRNGKILAGWSFLTGLNPDGSVDPLFREPSGWRGGVDVLLIQSDGRIIREGADSTIRCFPDGAIDPSFRMPPGQDQSGVYALQADDKLVFAASTVERFNSDGSSDASFRTVALTRNDSQSENRFASGVVVQSDGKIVVVGDFDRVNGVARRTLVRINSDGSLDEAFDAGTGLTAVEPASRGGPTQWPVAIQRDGKILVGGYFTHANGLPRRSIVRLNPNGSVDHTFDPGASVSGRGENVWAIAVQPDGQILVGGSFSEFNGVPRYEVARLNGDRHLLRLSIEKLPVGIRLRFIGVAGQSYTVERASTPTGPWSVIARPTAPIDGMVEYCDINPPAGSAFYRMSTL